MYLADVAAPLVRPLSSDVSRVIAPATATTPTTAEPRESGFSLESLQGRLTELRAGPDGAVLSCAFGLVLKAQQRGEPVAYVCGTTASFFPPDAADSGVDLAALVVIRTGDAPLRARAADELARSGAFALILVDLLPDEGDQGERARRIPPALISRLLGLAQKHATAIVFLSASEAGTVSNDDAPSAIGSLISLRGIVRRKPIDDTHARYVVELEAVKDKRGMAGWLQTEKYRAAVGLC